MIEMKGRRIIVTGGSSGIGLETARQLAVAGADVCVVGRGRDALDRAVEGIGKGTWAVSCDTAIEEEVAVVAAEADSRWGAVDGLVNNAGIAPMASLEETDPETWDHTFAVNVRGPYLMCRALAGLLRNGADPAVVNVSSTLADKAIPGMAAYNSAKAAVNQLTRSLALEWAPEIRVNAVMPAVIDTPIHSSRGMSREQVQQMGGVHPMQRVGRPADVAAMIVYLLSDAAAWMTGAVIPVDGGMLAG
jgi:meso-butanediol dehydrogenase/(S,S)-butanediol dehydrogenase/diacetyl reductase